MKLRNTAIVLGIGALTATGLSLLKVNKDLVVGSTAVVIGTGLMIALKDTEDSSISSGRLTGKELLEKIQSVGDVSKSDLVRECGYVGTKKDGGERLHYIAFYEALLEAKKHFPESLSDYSKAIGINPKYTYADYYTKRGHTKYKLGDSKGACQDWEKASELGDKESVELLKEHCSIFRNNKDQEKNSGKALGELKKTIHQHKCDIL